MGSSGMKRKGRKHQPKVGTAQERNYALHKEQQAVVGNFGVGSKSWLYWAALGVIVLIVVISLVTWIFLF